MAVWCVLRQRSLCFVVNSESNVTKLHRIRALVAMASMDFGDSIETLANGDVWIDVTMLFAGYFGANIATIALESVDPGLPTELYDIGVAARAFADYQLVTAGAACQRRSSSRPLRSTKRSPIESSRATVAAFSSSSRSTSTTRREVLMTTTPEPGR